MNETRNRPALKASELYFRSKNDAHRLIQTYKQEGYIKDCSNVKIDKNTNGYFPRYVPSCKEDSFDFLTDELYFAGCPKNCHYFKSHRQNKAETLIRHTKTISLLGIKKLEHVIKWPFKYFKSLPWASQALILLISFVLIFGNSPFYPLLIGLLQSTGSLNALT